MRVLRYSLLTILTVLSFSSCMQHNGQIGDWFGTWKLTAIAIDGDEDQTYQGNIFFQFQTNIVRIAVVDTSTSNSFSDCFGTWSEEGSTLILDFSYDANGNTSGFTPPTQTLLTHGMNTINISEQSSRSMVWTFQVSEPDRTITYHLKKQ